MKQCFQVNAADNVATMLEDADSEMVMVCGILPVREINVKERIFMGHKVALENVAANTEVIKFGVIIGLAITDIKCGEWVHLHNCQSRLDQRSNHLGLYAGVAKDTSYE